MKRKPRELTSEEQERIALNKALALSEKAARLTPAERFLEGYSQRHDADDTPDVPGSGGASIMSAR